nr:cytochrome c oxidase subunit 3 [Cyanidiaceae sp.]
MVSLVLKSLQRYPYHLVDPSPWPLIVSFSVLITLFGGVLYFHTYEGSLVILFFGISSLLTVIFVWWRDVTREATFEGHHTIIVQFGMRYGIILFIFSEVILFIAFFWAFFHNSLVPALESGVVWPPKGIQLFSPWDIPFLNTIILLLSGCAVTWSHNCIISGFRRQAIFSLILTIILAFIFTIFQVYEYAIASFHLSDGVYGSTFFIMTGLHGFHVIVGSLFLFVCVVRLVEYHFTIQHHYGFEAATWYWHFVDVVWLFLFVSIYWWGSF